MGWKKMTTQNKFLQGEKLEPRELLDLPMVDRCRYIVTEYYPKGFSVMEITSKLNELHPQPWMNHYDPMTVREALVEFYGKPDAQ